MKNLKTHDDVVLHLQGNWISEDGKVSFRIVGTGLINIKGVRVIDDIEEKESWFSLDRDESINIWRITNGPILGAGLKNQVIIEEQSFRILDYKVPANTISKFNKTS